MVTCNICGKPFKNTQGLRGHRNFVHPDTNVNARQPISSPATQLVVESTGRSHNPVLIEHILIKLEQQSNAIEQLLTSFEERLEHAESQLEQLSTQSQILAQHTHRENDTLHDRVVELDSRVGGIEGFISEYSELMRDLKVAVKREQARHSCEYPKWSPSDVFNEWSTGERKRQGCQLKESGRPMRIMTLPPTV